MLLGLWKFIQDEQNRTILSWLGGLAVPVIVGAFALFKYINDLKKKSPPATTPKQEKPEAIEASPKHTKSWDNDAAKLQQHLNELSRKQVQSVRLIEAEKIPQAIALLDSAESELNRIPAASARTRNQLGYIYKTFAQAYLTGGKDVDAKRNLNKAFDLFKHVENDRNASEQEIADAIHGSGNIKDLRNEVRAAIADYDRAIELNPQYCYAWYDRFLAYQQLAQQGEIDQAAMRESLDKIKELCDFTPQQIANLEAILRLT